MVVAATALISTLQAMCFGDATPDIATQPSGLAVLAPLWLHLAAALALGLAMPAMLTGLLRTAAGIIG
jgi:hypothetical protein